MQGEIIQTVSNLSASYKIVESEREVGQATLTNNFVRGGTFEFTVYGKTFSMGYEPKAQIESWFRKKTEKEDVPYILYSHDEPCGKIAIRTSEGSVFTRYQYYGMEWNAHQYSMYEVGLGKEGIKYPIYDGNTQIALIEKDTTVYNNLDIYHVTATSEQSFLVTTIFGLYLDASSYAHRGEIVKKSVEKTYYLTTNKKLKAKYDPDFKEKSKML